MIVQIFVKIMKSKKKNTKRLFVHKVKCKDGMNDGEIDDFKNAK